jgi:hypothetical protein
MDPDSRPKSSGGTGRLQVSETGVGDVHRAGHTFGTPPAAQAMTALPALPTAGSWVDHPVTGSLGRPARPH